MRLTAAAAGFVWCAAAFAESAPWRDLTPDEKAEIERALPRDPIAKPKRPRLVLVSHLAVRNGKPVVGHPSIPWGNYALGEMGVRTGAYRIEISNSEEAFTPANLARFDAIVFNNTAGVLFEAEAPRRALLDFVRGGKGFVGFHAAGATFVQWPKYDHFPEYGEMLGGYEDGGHPWGPDDVTHIRIDDPASPLTSMFRGPFAIREETFQFREPTLRDRIHVLLSIDVSKMDVTRRILPQRRKDMDFPVSWIRRYGEGRVFYTTMGHNPKTFADPALMRHFLAGLQYAMADLDADARPSSASR